MTEVLVVAEPQRGRLARWARAADWPLVVLALGAGVSFAAAPHLSLPFRRFGRWCVWGAAASVVMLGSIAGQLGGVQSGAGYATSKAAVIGMTKALARYAGPSGVRVNCVNPGFIESGMGLEKSPDERERTIAATPLGRAGTAEEVAAPEAETAAKAS